jgi:hypothetical protein
MVAACGLVLLVTAALSLAASPAPTDSNQPSSGDTGDGSPPGGPWLLPDTFGAGPIPGGLGIDGRGRGFHLGRFGSITITAIDGSNVSLKTDDGWTRTIAIGGSTKIRKAGQTIAASDLEVGDTIGFTETRQGDGSYTIDTIVVLLPRVAGTVSDVTADGFALKARDGTTWAITVSGSTTYAVGAKSGSKSDIKAGLDVVVEGNQGPSDTSLTALAVHVRLPTVFGQVTAKTADTITIKRVDGTTQTIHVSGDTTYRIAGADNPGLGDVKVGMSILARGTQRPDGSLDATVVGAGVARGFKRFGGWPFDFFGPHGHDTAPGASQSPTGSGTGTHS